MGTVSRNTGGDISTIIPDLIDQNHNQIDSNLQLQRGSKGFAQVGYYGSFFRNNVPIHVVAELGDGPDRDVARDRQCHEQRTRATTSARSARRPASRSRPRRKLVANGSYARNTQNDTFLTDEHHAGGAGDVR